jgi:hypothetical protein
MVTRVEVSSGHLYFARPARHQQTNARDPHSAHGPQRAVASSREYRLVSRYTCVPRASPPGRASSRKPSLHDFSREARCSSQP